MNVLEIKDYSVKNGDEYLFHIHELVIAKGEKVGFIGENGIGKSTLVKQIIYREQEGNTCINRLDSYGYLPQLLESEGMSGGEKQKKELVSLFLAENEWYILDEPTTNLDVENREWLIRNLKSQHQAVLLISHDRYLLDTVAEKILYIEDKALKIFSGNFTAWQKFQTAQFQKNMVAFEQHRKKQKTWQEEVRKKKQYAISMLKKKRNISYSDWKTRNYEGKAKKLDSMAKSLETRLERNDKVKQPRKEKAIKIQTVGKMNLKKGKTLLRVQETSLEGNHSVKIQIDECTIHAGDHIAIQGKNGSGKTQFLTALSNLKSRENVYLSPALSIGYFRQDLKLFQSDVSVLMDIIGDSPQNRQTVYDTLGSLGFKKGDMLKQYHQLSGGQKVRANLAKVLLGDYNLLLLDEPNKFLDIATLEALENFLVSFPGAFLLVSHDKRLIQHTCNIHYKMDSLELSASLINSRALPKNKPSKLIELEFKRSQLLLDPNVEMAEIRKIDEEIVILKGNL